MIHNAKLYYVFVMVTWKTTNKSSRNLRYWAHVKINICYQQTKLEQTPRNGEGQGSLVCCIHGITKSGTWLSDWTTIANLLLSHNFCYERYIKTGEREFPGDPVYRTMFLKQGTQLWSLVRELDPTLHSFKIPHATTKASAAK